MFAVLACGQSSETNQVNSLSSTAVNASPSDLPSVKVTATDLTKAYKANELAADEKYRGKSLEVSGKVTSIQEVMGSIQVDIEGFKENGINIVSVKCTFPDSEKAVVAKLVSGKNATLVGTGDGMTLNLYVGLTHCRVKE